MYSAQSNIYYSQILKAITIIQPVYELYVSPSFEDSSDKINTKQSIKLNI